MDTVTLEAMLTECKDQLSPQAVKEVEDQIAVVKAVGEAIGVSSSDLETINLHFETYDEAMTAYKAIYRLKDTW